MNNGKKRGSWYGVLLLISGACLMQTSPAFAALSNAELEKKLNQALEKIEQLSDKVRQLESEKKPPQAITGKPQEQAVTPAATSEPPQSQRIAQLEQQVNQLASGMGNRSVDDGVPLHGFIDVGAATSTDAQPKGANIGKIDFYLTPRISDRTKALVELNVEVGEDGTIGTDLERMQLGYVFSDKLTLWAGRFHTPYGYWNTAFHHGAQIQTSILRPRFLEFEDTGGILPAHNVGLWGTGAFRAGAGKFSYDLFIANGPRIDNGVLDPNLASDDNHSAMVGGNVGYLFSGTLDGLKIGLHGLKGDVDSNAYINSVGDALAASRNEINMYGSYVVYLSDAWEVMNEYYAFDDKNIDGGSGSHHSWAAYSQIGYAIAGWTPYLRVEKTDLDQNDNYFATQESGQSYRRGAIGLRYDLDPKSALKFEAMRTRYTDRDERSVGEGRVQYAVRF